jgi:hypothetical protein
VLVLITFLDPFLILINNLNTVLAIKKIDNGAGVLKNLNTMAVFMNSLTTVWYSLTI